MIRKIKVFGWVVFEIESHDEETGAPDFTSNSQPAGFVTTRIIPPKPDEE